MSKKNTKARIAAYKKWEQLEEERGEEIYDYIEDHPGGTAYSLAKTLKIPRPTLQNLLKQLEDDGLLVSELKTEKNRSKRVYRVKRFEEYDFPINKTELLIPEMHLESIFSTIGIQNPKREVIATFNTIMTEFGYNLAKKSIENAKKAQREVTAEDLLQVYERK